jgi:cytochrome c peroxidase
MAQRFTFLAAAVLWFAQLTPAAEPPRFKSPLGLAVDQTGQRAYVALHTAGTVAVVDLQAGKVVREIAVGPGPGFVELSPEWNPGRPCAYCLESSEVVYLDLARGAASGRLSVDPERMRLFAAQANLSHVFPQPDPTESEGGYYDPIRSSATDGWNVFSLARSPKGNVPATQVAQGWVFTTELRWGIFNGMVHSAPLDEPQRSYADPTQVLLMPKGKTVFVSCAGSDTVLAVDQERLGKHAARPSDADFRDPPRDLSRSRLYVTARLATQANPRCLALSGDGKTLVVSNYLGDSLTVIDTTALRVLRHIRLGEAEPDAVRRGEILFNSSRMTFQGQFTCASCHPNGGSDGLTWDLERDGVGNFKKTKSLLGVKDTAPYGWHGSSPTLADRVRGTLRTLHRHEPTDAEVGDLVAYLESLPSPRPLPVKKEDQPAVERGRAIFQGKGQCATCHHRVALDDGKSHDVGTRGPTDTQDRFDTAALRGVARTAPYLHDGRAATLEEAFTKHNPKQRHGAAHTLSREELADLIAYLKSL